MNAPADGELQSREAPGTRLPASRAPGQTQAMASTGAASIGLLAILEWLARRVSDASTMLDAIQDLDRKADLVAPSQAPAVVYVALVIGASAYILWKFAFVMAVQRSHEAV